MNKENKMKFSFSFFINAWTFGKFGNTPEVRLLNKI